MSTAPATAREYLTTSDIAEMLGVAIDKVHGWLASGELRAINVAQRPGGRPRWRISRADLDAFLSARASTPATTTVRPVRRRRAPVEVTQYY